jgi:hypothetical protein
MTPAARQITDGLSQALALIEHADSLGHSPVGLHELKEAGALVAKAQMALRRHTTVYAMRTPTRGKLFHQLYADPAVTAFWCALGAPTLHASVFSRLQLRTLEQLEQLNYKQLSLTKGVGPNVATTAHYILERRERHFVGVGEEPLDLAALLAAQQAKKD